VLDPIFVDCGVIYWRSFVGGNIWLSGNFRFMRYHSFSGVKKKGWREGKRRLRTRVGREGNGQSEVEAKLGV
jgi:hypothetical protein